VIHGTKPKNFIFHYLSQVNLLNKALFLGFARENSSDPEILRISIQTLETPALLMLERLLETKRMVNLRFPACTVGRGCLETLQYPGAEFAQSLPCKIASCRNPVLCRQRENKCFSLFVENQGGGGKLIYLTASTVAWSVGMRMGVLPITVLAGMKDSIAVL
jgi:hypothetical protein